ncbi:MAG: cupin domain-containing protein [Mesorhizobium sp.]|uniref:ChrR family anti-sigma-E factor n=1 Tax=Mesorhizobium sp. TaxID=1871066 RepID=UPI001ACC0010|nr:ChrR family anti-sigma-E factor [Mesorhizobium sp.]MBN9219303.1 cupin domain-containing protein [Mesorhizobium sp.]
MTEAIVHHPTDETLAAFASGTLDQARGLVVLMHLSLCAACSRKVGRFEAIGGELLEQAASVSMEPGALRNVLRLIEDNPSAPETRLNEPLDHYQLGPWRWVGPGVRQRSVSVPEVSNIKVFMLKAAPGTRLPHHRHDGYEWTCVLEGAFEHQFGRYGPGDFDEADETMEHKPTVCAGDPCVCIVALEGNIVLQSRLGRILQPLFRL